MRLAVPKEARPGETRAALVPESVRKLGAAGVSVAVERGAGERAGITDRAYADAGAEIVADHAALVGGADVVVRVGAPAVGGGGGGQGGRDEVGAMRAGSILLTSLMPTRNTGAVRALAAAGVTALSTDTIPRVTRAQAMDTLSSMANIAGYKGALIAAMELGKYFPMLMTAAGTVPPARVFVIGAGVAGLQAIATARRLGAVVFATDVRPEVREQIESVGARYVGIDLGSAVSGGGAAGGYARALAEEDKRRQSELLAEQCAAADAVITTALIGGVVAPRLVSAGMVGRMRPGSVIVDLAADGGGNCELSRPGETVDAGGVRIAAPLNVAATMPAHASLLWSRNMTAFLLAFLKDGALKLDRADEIIAGAMITCGGEVVNAGAREALEREG